MEDGPKPRATLAERILPKPLHHCIGQIFKQGITDTALVGGTALAGYYAGHRRSDDIDLFTANETAFQAAVLAVKHLEKLDVSFSNQSRSSQYFHANSTFRGHSFTIDVVLDENLFKVGKFETVGGVTVATLETLLRMKIATLVSRASEKDLFDVLWLFEKFPSLKIEEWIALGQTVDKGVNGENLLASIAATKLRKEACDFSLDPKRSADGVFKDLLAFQKKLVKEIALYLKALPTPPLGKLARKMN